MNLAKTLKIHRVSTVFKYLGKSLDYSKFVSQHSSMNQIHAYFSLLYWYYFYGNDFNDYCTFRFWDKSHKEKKSYISFRRNDILRYALSTPKVYEIFLDKVKFNKRFKKYILRNWIEVNGKENLPIREFLDEYGCAIYKPRNDYGGHGIMKIESNSLCNSLMGRGIIEEIIENSDCLKRIAPGSLNTIRIVTLIDKYGNLHILASVLRMGNGSSFTDNYHDGGLACAIDYTTGMLKGNAFGMGCKEYSEHPFSKIKFDGYKVDGFQECLNLVRELAFEEPEARYVGWDFAITPKGIDLIEGNIPPGEDITQIAAGRGLWNEIKELI